MRLITHRGFAAVSGEPAICLRATLQALDVALPTVFRDRGSEIATWGLPEWNTDQGALLLCASARRHERDLTPARVRKLMHSSPSALIEILPTFAAVSQLPSGGTRAVTDYLGFRHVFHGVRHGVGILSTSSRACATSLGTGLDVEAVAVQSSLGWQLGQRTVFSEVTKLAPGGGATLEADGVVNLSTVQTTGAVENLQLDHAVRTAAQVLRTYLTSYLEDHPEAGLQLTGGQDSRLLLSAIPPKQRTGLRVVTLGRPGEPDVDIAAELAARFGMRHELLSLAGLDDIDPADAHALCTDAAHRLDYSADPLAHAALTYAESRSEPGPRISGLGGEVARGFYYLGPPTSAPVSPGRARRLAQWRMFVNEGVPSEALDQSFASWARDFATQEVVRVLTETGRPWMSATDDLYLTHRMQRWGGVTETAVCLDREIINPMLDDRFISIAMALEPRHKRNSRFLSRLQVELDPELSAVPLDGRPPPVAYAHRSVQNSARMTASTLRRARHKVVQKVRRQNRPPAGGEILAGKVIEHWRSRPEVLAPLIGLGVFDQDWLDMLTSGATSPPSSAVALMVNLIAATEP